MEEKVFPRIKQDKVGMSEQFITFLGYKHDITIKGNMHSALPLPQRINSFVVHIVPKTLTVESKKYPESTNNVYTMKLMYWTMYM